VRKRIALVLLCCPYIYLSIAQTPEKAAKDAFMISRMVEKYHVQPRPLDDEMSSLIFSQLLETLDEAKVFFTKQDIDQLSKYQYALDDEIKNTRSDFLKLFIGIYKQRLQQADTMADNICAKPFNFSIKEKLTVAEDTSYPANPNARHEKFYKELKLFALYRIVEKIDVNAGPPTKKYIDSLEPIMRRKANNSIKRLVKRILQSPRGIEYILGNIYCQMLASTYDPHTAYFPPDVKNLFESSIGNRPLEFGLTLSEDENGNPEVGRLKPGSPAFQSGQINEGDKISSIQWENKDPIDISDASAEEIGYMLSSAGGDKATITFKKQDGTTRQVVLHKEKSTGAEEGENRVKSFILKGTHSFGFISLPDFYSDWDDNRGINGCANDVAKEIIKLKKENIEGLILDLRYNGGGSMEEAIELSGIFIDAGPVGQEKSRGEKVATLKDINRGTIYDGPLLLLVNGLSASASEMVAGTLQDYHRAMIVGSPTYGKATAQVVLPVDTTINLETYRGNKEADSYLKITISKLYRINGTSAQVSGVIPDIELPDLSTESSDREANEKNAIHVSNIEANKYYRPLAPLPVSIAQRVADKQLDSSVYFKKILRLNQLAKAEKNKKDDSLLMDDVLQMEKERSVSGVSKKMDNPTKPPYTVTNHSYEERRLQSNEALKKVDDEWKKRLLEDAYVQVAYSLLTVMAK
jgi:carboxyl-terminal processing protease